MYTIGFAFGNCCSKIGGSLCMTIWLNEMKKKFLWSNYFNTERLKIIRISCRNVVRRYILRTLILKIVFKIRKDTPRDNFTTPFIACACHLKSKAKFFQHGLPVFIFARWVCILLSYRRFRFYGCPHSSSFFKNSLIYGLFSTLKVGMKAIYRHLWYCSPSISNVYPIAHLGLQSLGLTSRLQTDAFWMSFFIFSGKPFRKPWYSQIGRASWRERV